MSSILETALKLKILCALNNCPMPLEVLMKKCPKNLTKREFAEFLNEMFVNGEIKLNKNKEVYV